MSSNNQLKQFLDFLQNNSSKVMSVMFKAFFVAAFILSLITYFSLWKKVQSSKAVNFTLSQRIDEQKDQISSLNNQLFKYEQMQSSISDIVIKQQDMLDFLFTTNLSIIDLKNYQNNLVVQGKIFLDKPDKRAVLLAKDLDSLSEGYIYQIWAVSGINPKSIGTFREDGEGKAFVEMRYIPDSQKINRFLVTVETSPGATEPTGNMYLLGVM